MLSVLSLSREFSYNVAHIHPIMWNDTDNRKEKAARKRRVFIHHSDSDVNRIDFVNRKNLQYIYMNIHKRVKKCIKVFHYLLFAFGIFKVLCVSRNT